ncbi:TPA: hypothetical protein ACGUON_004565 [Vibrio vulnificus]|nr:hypothetical protein [Vibrio vulnificus]
MRQIGYTQNVKKLLIYLVFFVVGVTFGVLLTYVHFYENLQQGSDTHELMERVLEYSNVPISADNYACEGKPLRTVGSVVASLLEFNKINKVNTLTYGCFSDSCTISVSSCQPWRDSECSSRFLKFNIENNNEINPDTFSCIDMPQAHNKAFKSDSQRLAFFILSLGLVFTVVWSGFVVALLTP